VELGAQSGLLAAIVSAAVAISVILRGRRSRVNTFFIVFCGNLLLHFLAAFFYHFSGKFIWFRIDLIAASLLPVTALQFFGHFLWKEPKTPRKYVITAYVFSTGLVAFLFTPWSNNKPTIALVVAVVFTAMYLCAYLAYLRYRSLTSQRERTRLRYLLVVMLVATTFILLGMMPGGLGFLRTWGDLVSIFFLYFLSQSLLKYRLLDLQELLGRGLVLIAVALILALVFGALVLWAGVSPEVSLFQTFIASFVILILFEPLRDKVEGSTNRLLFRERYEFRSKLEDLRREVANILDPQQMSNVILDTLYESMRITRSSVYFQEDGGASYYLAGYRGPKPPSRVDVAAHRAFFDQVKKTPTVVLSETYERFLAEHSVPADSSKPSSEVQHARQVLKTLAHMKSAVCIPFPSQVEILGLWNLQDEASAESYSTEEIARLIALGEQAAINIENSKMFERIRERDRLAVLGEMSAGLAHEIRNPLSAIKGAAQYLDPSSVGDDASQFLKIIIEEADRLNQVVDQFLDYSRPFHAHKDPTDINRIIEQTTRLLSTGFNEQDIDIKLELQADLPLVDANAPQLTQVFINLLNNAMESMPGGGQLLVRTKLRSSGFGSWSGLRRHTGAVEVQVVDTGRGISPSQQDRLFVPFFTTKEHGTGLGLSISQRIIEHHGGEIRVRSKEGEGSTFTVVLPYPADTTAPTESADKKADKPAAPGDLPFPDEDSREKS